MKSISFDRAVNYYDATRRIDPDGSKELIASLIDILEPGSKTLEIGIGTGRIALPMLKAGFRVSGIDIARQMMRRLIEKLPKDTPQPILAQANAANLPFKSDLYDGVLTVHVMHLVGDPQGVVREIRRVLRSGGVNLNGHGWRDPDSPIARTRDKWRQILEDRAGEQQQPGVRGQEALIELLSAYGAKMDKIQTNEWRTQRNLGEYIRNLENRVFSSTWHRFPKASTLNASTNLRNGLSTNSGRLSWFTK